MPLEHNPATAASAGIPNRGLPQAPPSPSRWPCVTLTVQIFLHGATWPASGPKRGGPAAKPTRGFLLRKRGGEGTVAHNGGSLTRLSSRRRVRLELPRPMKSPASSRVPNVVRDRLDDRPVQTHILFRLNFKKENLKIIFSKKRRIYSIESVICGFLTEQPYSFGALRWRNTTI